MSHNGEVTVSTDESGAEGRQRVPNRTADWSSTRSPHMSGEQGPTALSNS